MMKIKNQSIKSMVSKATSRCSANTSPPMGEECPTRLSLGRPQESGVALLTVLALLAIFAVVLVGFTFTIRMEELTLRAYRDSVNVNEGSEAAIQGVLGQLSQEFDPDKVHTVLGREQPRYVSLLDPWAVGYAGRVDESITYDARSHQLDTRSPRLSRRTEFKLFPTPIPLGVDEDPQGDTNGDGAPGLRSVDDDKDGITDPETVEGSLLSSDDDEDFLVDEDGLNQRRDGLLFAQGTGYDEDGDRLGVFDENAKLNMNFAGNNFSDNGDFTYNQGVGPHELDLPLYLFSRIVRFRSLSGGISNFAAGNAENLAQNIVATRYGSIDGQAGSNFKPGQNNTDDNGNDNPEIVEVSEFSEVAGTQSFDGEPWVVVGNRQDDDGDGLINEEDEIYIGVMTESSGGSSFSGPINSENAEDFRPGNFIDDDGDGFIDEADEGIDDPSEFDVFTPKGDDRPFGSVEDLRLLQGLRGAPAAQNPNESQFPTTFEILRQSTTIYSQSDQISGPLSARFNQINKINPNNSFNWQPVDLWDPVRNTRRQADFQYGPPVKINDLLPLQADLDGDWQLEAEVDVQNGEADGVDNDGDGLIDEPSDDWDGNFYPSGDHDGFGEPDVGATGFRNGRDDDNDGRNEDDGRDENRIHDNLRLLPIDNPINPDNRENFDGRFRDENNQELRAGLVLEGNGRDDDGDMQVDDTGDFNGDGQLSYDPEWHVSEDAWGDLSADGFPGLGADIRFREDDTAEGDIISRLETSNDLVVTNFADDDWDGYADFFDPQVMAAMYAPEMDGVDNDGDGEVDEIGERYIATFDDDEDGRFDEDPPQFQLAVNLIDYIDTFAPFQISEDPNIQNALSISDNDPVLSDPVTFFTTDLYNTRQRAFRMNSRFLAGVNNNVRNRNLFDEYTRLAMPNPPQTGMQTTFQGVEAVRINEAFPKPVIRLQAEDVLERVEYRPGLLNTQPPQQPQQQQLPFSIQPNNNLFTLNSGGGDDGTEPTVGQYDSNWGTVAGTLAVGAQTQFRQFSHILLPEGFRHTFNPFNPIANADTLAPEFIFSVTNVKHQGDQAVQVGIQGVEQATWVFENIPNGVYDFALYISPNHVDHDEVTYRFNGRPIDLISDARGLNAAQTPGQSPAQFQRNMAHITDGNRLIPFPLNYRLVPASVPNQENPMAPANRIVVTDNTLEVEIIANQPGENIDFYVTSFDRIDLFNPNIQYVELVNLSHHDIDLTGWTVSTPYGSYVLTDDDIDPIIHRIKPGWKEDDGSNLQASNGRPGQSVAFEPLLDKANQIGNQLDSTERLLEDNKLLLAFNKDALQEYVETHFPDVEELDNRIVEPQLDVAQRTRLLNVLSEDMITAGFATAQLSDLRFKLVDFQQDVLVDNRKTKLVTLRDPAGNFIDSFEYTTTFNNRIVDIPANAPAQNAPAQTSTLDLIAVPGYKGFESFERTDPTHFRTEQAAVDIGPLPQELVNTIDLPHWRSLILGTGSVPPRFELRGERKVPSNIRLDVKDAIIANVELDEDSGEMSRTAIGGYTEGNDTNDRGITRFKDSFANSIFPEQQQFDGLRDSHWNGWDFIGDHFEYEEELENVPPVLLNNWESSQSMAWEAVMGVRGIMRPFQLDSRKPVLYNNLGGFENFLNVNRDNPQQWQAANTNFTAFIWRLGARELVRAGYDPDVDDQLTVRVLGRTEVQLLGRETDTPLPVGEVLVNPVVRTLNPGSVGLLQSGQTAENDDSIYHFGDGAGNLNPQPVFAKLFHGDTAFTVNMRESNNVLFQDLRNTSGNEPIFEIAVVMRKTTQDLSITSGNPANRPDLQGRGLTGPNNADGFYLLASGQNNIGQPVGNTGDDNYFFKGIELLGRGRQTSGNSSGDDELQKMLAGTPGRDNTGYVPAYPRRRLEINGSQRDEFDIIDNTAYVKNGPLATVGELSRVYTGNKFETVNTPIIPQRLEDQARGGVNSRSFSNPELAQRASSDDESRIELAQRERLDQWENQYNQLYNMITTSNQGVVPGLVNINTAPREVLTALPSTPPPESPGGPMPSLQERFEFNSIVADFIIEGRQPGGHDLLFGIADLDDDEFLTEFRGGRRTPPDTLADFKLMSSGRSVRGFKDFDDIVSQVFSPLNLQAEDVKEDTLDWNNVYNTTIQSLPDDGPYPDIGTLLAQITHLKRRELFSSALSRNQDRTFDGKPDGIGDLRQHLNDQLSRDLTPEDMEALMNRISNLITVRSRAFEILTQGRVFDEAGNITAQRKLQTVYER